MVQELSAFDSIDPNDGHVVLGHFECWDCGERSPWVGSNERGTLVTEWDANRNKQTGHKKFYMWSVTRNTSRLFWERR